MEKASFCLVLALLISAVLAFPEKSSRTVASDHSAVPTSDVHTQLGENVRISPESSTHLNSSAIHASLAIGDTTYMMNDCPYCFVMKGINLNPGTAFDVCGSFQMTGTIKNQLEQAMKFARTCGADAFVLSNGIAYPKQRPFTIVADSTSTSVIFQGEDQINGVALEIAETTFPTLPAASLDAARTIALQGQGAGGFTFTGTEVLPRVGPYRGTISAGATSKTFGPLVWMNNINIVGGDTACGERTFSNALLSIEGRVKEAWPIVLQCGGDSFTMQTSSGSQSYWPKKGPATNVVADATVTSIVLGSSAIISRTNFNVGHDPWGFFDYTTTGGYPSPLEAAIFQAKALGADAIVTTSIPNGIRFWPKVGPLETGPNVAGQTTYVFGNRGPSAILYDGTSYAKGSGPTLSLRGNSQIAQLSSDNIYSSLTISAGLSVSLFDQPNFVTALLTRTGPVAIPDLGTLGADNAVSSVQSLVTVYSQACSSGSCTSPDYCPKLTTPNGRVVYTKNGVEVSKVQLGATASIECNPGYVVSPGTTSITCPVNGVWPSTLTSCVLVTTGDTCAAGLGIASVVRVPVNKASFSFDLDATSSSGYSGYIFMPLIPKSKVKSLTFSLSNNGLAADHNVAVYISPDCGYQWSGAPNQDQLVTDGGFGSYVPDITFPDSSFSSEFPSYSGLPIPSLYYFDFQPLEASPATPITYTLSITGADASNNPLPAIPSSAFKALPNCPGAGPRVNLGAKSATITLTLVDGFVASAYINVAFPSTVASFKYTLVTTVPSAHLAIYMSPLCPYKAADYLIASPNTVPSPAFIFTASNYPRKILPPYYRIDFQVISAVATVPFFEKTHSLESGVSTIDIQLSFEAFDDSGNDITNTVTFLASEPEATVLTDPHVRTFDNMHMTVFGEGDYALAESASSGMQFHARFCKNKRGPWAAWTCAVALRCSQGESPIEISAASFVVTSTTSTMSNSTTTASSALVERLGPSSMRILCGGIKLTVDRARFHRMHYFNMRVSSTAGQADFRGLLGTPNGDKDDDIIHRDGRVWVPEGNQKHFIGVEHQNITAFHDSWRVPASKRLFVGAFQMPQGDLPIVAANGMQGTHSTISEQVATEACHGAGVVTEVKLAMCVYDVMATGSLRHARTFSTL